MDQNEARQQILDDEHLRLLALFHYIAGGLTIVFSSFFIIHLVFMSIMFSNPEMFGADMAQMEGVDAEQFLGFFIAFIGFFVVLGVAYGIAQILSGRFMKRRMHRTFSLIVAIPSLLFIPFGTILGVFTLIVLGRDSIKQLYAQQELIP